MVTVIITRKITFEISRENSFILQKEKMFGIRKIKSRYVRDVFCQIPNVVKFLITSLNYTAIFIQLRKLFQRFCTRAFASGWVRDFWSPQKWIKGLGGMP